MFGDRSCVIQIKAHESKSDKTRTPTQLAATVLLAILVVVREPRPTNQSQVLEACEDTYRGMIEEDTQDAARSEGSKANPRNAQDSNHIKADHNFPPHFLVVFHSHTAGKGKTRRETKHNEDYSIGHTKPPGLLGFV